MLLIEADGKALFEQYGISVPAGVLVTAPPVADLPGTGPWIVKAQVPVGGRGKAGGVLRGVSLQQVNAAVQRLVGTRLKGHRVDACLVEQAVVGEERYLAVMVDAASYGVRVIYAAAGGVEIEQTDASAGRVCAPEVEAIAAAVSELVAAEPPTQRDAIVAIGRRLAIGNGILTVETEAQALARARPGQLDKGGGAAKACLVSVVPAPGASGRR